MHLSLSDVGWPSDIQSGLDGLSMTIDALFVFYVIGTAATILTIFMGLIALFYSPSQLISFSSLWLASLSFLSLLNASLMITIVQTKAVDFINKYGNDIGVYAYKGRKYMALTWAAVAVMFLARTAWAVEIIIGKKNRRGDTSGRQLGQQVVRSI
jgi:hypothetical protein